MAKEDAKELALGGEKDMVEDMMLSSDGREGEANEQARKADDVVGSGTAESLDVDWPRELVRSISTPGRDQMRKSRSDNAVVCSKS